MFQLILTDFSIYAYIGNCMVLKVSYKENEKKNEKFNEYDFEQF